MVLKRSLEVSVWDALTYEQFQDSFMDNVFMWAILHYLNETYGDAKAETLKQLSFT
jgi:hypothetical protein